MSLLARIASYYYSRIECRHMTSAVELNKQFWFNVSAFCSTDVLNRSSKTGIQTIPASAYTITCDCEKIECLAQHNAI